MTHLNANQSGTPGTPKDTSMKPALLRFRRITVAATLLGLLGTGAALAHGVDAGVQVEVVGEPSWSLSPVYHILMAHFPVALWMAAYLFILIRCLSDSEFAVRLQKAVWPLAALGTLAGFVTLALATIGAIVITITGTLGGSLGGTPSLVTESLSWIGWNVYMTFYLPTWMLVVYGVGTVVLIAIGIVGRRRA